MRLFETGRSWTTTVTARSRRPPDGRPRLVRDLVGAVGEPFEAADLGLLDARDLDAVVAAERKRRSAPGAVSGTP